MKHSHYLFGFLLSLGLLNTLKAQDSNVPEDYQFKANTIRSEVAGESKTLFTEKQQISTAKTGCSLVQSKWKERQIIQKKNGYKIITAGNDEIIEVKKKKNGITKVSYLNDFETLEYTILKSGKTKYKYLYQNGCVKIKSKKLDLVFQTRINLIYQRKKLMKI